MSFWSDMELFIDFIKVSLIVFSFLVFFEVGQLIISREWRGKLILLFDWDSRSYSWMLISCLELIFFCDYILYKVENYDFSKLSIFFGTKVGTFSFNEIYVVGITILPCEFEFLLFIAFFLNFYIFSIFS